MPALGKGLGSLIPNKNKNSQNSRDFFSARSFSADEAGRKKIDDATKGIPIDTADQKDELSFWINFARVEEYTWRAGQKAQGKNVEEMRVALKADGKAAYKKIDAVISLFKKQDVFRFNLITDLEADPNAAAAAPAK